ncbi:transposable element Tc1 transposase [Trichonephila clavipes]|nr:transposable element Tc1 transposase [Trichonephila clavipes]
MNFCHHETFQCLLKQSEMYCTALVLKPELPHKKTPYISEVDKKRLLEFAMKYKNKPMDFWKKVIFSADSKFDIFTPPGIRKIWRKSKTALETKNVFPTLKHGGGNAMLWGCVDHNGAESDKKLSMENNFIFQQVNDPKHTAIVTKTWLLYHAPRRLEMPPQSPDLNPIEHLWMPLDNEFRKKCDWNVDAPSWKYLKKLESPRVSSIGFGNDSKMMVMFSLRSDSRRTLIWRAPGIRYHQENTIERHHYVCAGWLFWGGIILGSRTDLHV